MRSGIAPFAVCLAALLCIPALVARPETWADPLNPSKPLKATLSGIYGPLVVLETTDHRTRFVQLESLTGEDARRASEFLEAQPAASTLAQPVGSFSQELSGRLEQLREGNLVAVEGAQMPEPLFYVLYFSASWCGPCQRFTPWLAEAYREQKRGGASDFEVIFISRDEGRGAMTAYMKKRQMPWPALEYERTRAREFSRYAGAGIPCVAVVDRNGTILFHSYVNGKYAGPAEPWERFLRFREAVAPDSPAALRARFRLVCHTRAARHATSVAPAEVFSSTALDPARFRNEGIAEFTAKVFVGADGTVLSASADALPISLASYVEAELRRWLFLPKVDHGKCTNDTLEIPVRIAGQ